MFPLPCALPSQLAFSLSLPNLQPRQSFHYGDFPITSELGFMKAIWNGFIFS